MGTCEPSHTIYNRDIVVKPTQPINFIVCEPTQAIKIDDFHKQRKHNVIKEAKRIQSTARGWKEKFAIDCHHVVIFLHGYNNSELVMNKRAAQLDSELGTSKVITAPFNWPSYCSTFGYDTDQKTVESCAELFVTYLTEIRKGPIHKFKQIDIVAHSMGNYLLTQAIKASNLQLFGGCNIICVAADAPYDEYSECMVALQGTVSNWVHYWTNADWALWASSSIFVNWKKRAGQRECKYKDKCNVLSIEWKIHKGLSHSYIDDILGKDDELADDVLKRLHLEPKDDGSHQDEVPSDDKAKQEYFKKYSELWNKVYVDGDDVKWFEILDRAMYKDKDGYRFGMDLFGEFKVQHHSWFGTYRIIYRRDKKNNKWKEMLCSGEWDEIKKQYNDYVTMLKWKKAQYQA